MALLFEFLQDSTSTQILLLLLLPLLLFLLHSHCRRRLPFPPGPRPLPLIGNLRDAHRLTHRGLADLHRTFGPLVHLRLGSLHVVGVSTPDMARLILRSHDSDFADRPVTSAIHYLTYDLSDMAFAPSGPFWRQMRKLCVVRLFSRSRAESWASVRDEIDNSIASVATKIGQNLDVGELAFSLMTNVTYRAAFGARSDADQTEFGSIVAEFSRLFGAFGVGDMFPWLRWWDAQGIKRRMKKARAELDRFIDRIIDEHLAKPKEECSTEEVDMVDDMIAFLDEGGGDNEGQESLKLSRDNIKGIIMVCLLNLCTLN